MTIRNLDPCFRPRSVAIVGASARVGSVGSIVLNNVLGGGFGGTVLPVNPKYDSIGSCHAFVRLRNSGDT